MNCDLQEERAAKRKRRDANEDEESEEAEQHLCTQCKAVFLSIKRLNEHIKRVHAPVSNRTCPFCAQVFSNAGSLPRHTMICRQRPEASITCIMPTSNVPSSPTSPHTKAKSHKKSYIAVERFLKRLIEFLKAGDFTYSLESRLAPLAPSTIASYVSFIRKYLEAVVQGLISGHGDDILKEESNDKTYQMLVLLCGKLDHISHFVRAREADQFVRRSQVNLMCALLWHLAFLHHISHPRVTTSMWCEEDLLLRKILLPPTRDAITELQACLGESRRYLRQQIGRLKDQAEQQIKARNSQEALQERGTWFSIDWMNAMAQALNEEGWARMRRLEVAIGSTSHAEFVSVQSQQRAQFDWLRDWIIYSLFVDIPPMRPQNGELEIMDHREPAGSRQTNGLLFFTSHTVLQIVHYKNAAFLGEHVIELPEQLHAKLLAYLRVVRPVYSLSIGHSTDEETIDTEDSSSEDEEELATEDKSSQLPHNNNQSSCSTHHNELRAEVSKWRGQSPWFFLKPGNLPAKRIGTLWINFVHHNTGKKTNLRVWRKVAETASSKSNSLDQQQMLSGALLHQHRTGQEYYVTHNPTEKSQQLHQVWNGLMNQQSSQTLTLSQATSSVFASIP